MAYTRGRDGAEMNPRATSTISDKEWDSLNRRRSQVFETDEEYQARGDASDAQKRQADES